MYSSSIWIVEAISNWKPFNVIVTQLKRGKNVAASISISMSWKVSTLYLGKLYFDLLYSSKLLWWEIVHSQVVGTKSKMGVGFTKHLGGLKFGQTAKRDRLELKKVVKKGDSKIEMLKSGDFFPPSPINIFFKPRSRFDNTLYFDITLMLNGVIILWSAFI